MTASMHDLRGAVRAAKRRFRRHIRGPVVAGYAAEWTRRYVACLDAAEALDRAEAERGKDGCPEPLPAVVAAAIDEVFAMAKACRDGSGEVAR